MRSISSVIDSLESRLLRAADLRFTTSSTLLDIDIAGEALPIKGTTLIRNDGDTGTLVAVPYRAALFEDNNLFHEIASLGTGTIPAVDAGTDAVIDFEFPVPTSLLGSGYAVGFILDPDNVIPESNENNNAISQAAGVRFATTLTGDSVSGTAGHDSIRMFTRNGAIIISGASGSPASGFQMASIADAPRLSIDLKAGNDNLDAQAVEGVGLDVTAGDGNDLIYSGAGDDVLLGDAGNDTIAGHAGDDEIRGGNGRDLLQGGGGDDRVIGNAQSDSLFGNAGNDALFGNGGRDILHGDPGNDRLSGGTGDDVLSDSYVVQADTLNGNAGNDTGYVDINDLLSSIEMH